MTKFLRISALILAALLIMTGGTMLLSYAANIRTQHRADELLKIVRQWRLNETTFSDTQPVRISYKARKDPSGSVTGSPSEQTYNIVIGNDVLEATRIKYPKVWRFGFKPSGVLVVLRYRDEKLSYVSYSFGTPVRVGSGAIVELVGETRVQQDSRSGINGNYSVGYYLRPSPIVANASELGLAATITPRATDEEYNAAFNLDLSCVSTIRGCQALCQIMPSVWREAHRRYQNKEISLPQEELENPICVSITP